MIGAIQRDLISIDWDLKGGGEIRLLNLAVVLRRFERNVILKYR